MGRSTASCFKIMTCSGNIVDNDDIRAPESKGSSDRSRWSIHKRSARHQVQNNIEGSETLLGGKESQGSMNDSSYVPHNTSALDDKFGTQWTAEKPVLPPSADLGSAEITGAADDVSKVDISLDESVIIIIQAAIRGSLAQRKLLKNKNAIKLQAAVRGHLVRNHAMGTLRCAQAIVKMQALVRARRACVAAEGSSSEEKLPDKHGDGSSDILVKEASGNKSPAMQNSIEKLLSNRFASQLLDKTQATQPIKIKCDPFKSDSTWKWLERWMSVLAREVEQSQQLGTRLDKQEIVELYDNQTVSPHLSEDCLPIDIKSSSAATAVSAESEDNLKKYDARESDSQAPEVAPLSMSPIAVQNGKIGTEILRDCSLNLPPGESGHSSGDHEMVSEQSENSVETVSLEQQATEENKFLLGSRKASNPSLLAAQATFEHLSSTVNSGSSNDSYKQDTGVGSNICNVSLPTDKELQTKEIEVTEVHFGGSQCGSEPSILSTMDLPERSEVGVMESDQEAKIAMTDVWKDDITISKNHFSENDLSHPIPVEIENSDYNSGVNVEPDGQVIAIDDSFQVEKPEKHTYEHLLEESKMDPHQQEHPSPPQAPPKSPLTIPESEGTKSSHISAKPKRTKIEEGGSNKKNTSCSPARRSSNPGYKSVSIVERLPKEHKTDHLDHESRDINGGSLLPSYMQATESARAKAVASNSPRSSPDVHDKAIKKRNSSPSVSGKRGSPRNQKPVSPAEQSSKGNGVHSHEKKGQK